MIKSSKNLKFRKSAKLKLDHETVRILGIQELAVAVGGASGGTSGRDCSGPGATGNLGCCPN
jgi:hypothetical protein